MAASKIFTLAGDLVSAITTASADPSKWHGDVVTKYGDFAASNAVQISSTSKIRREHLVIGDLRVFVGYNLRELGDNRDRCDMFANYPVGIGVYQRFSPPGTSVGSVNVPVAVTDLDPFLSVVESLEDYFYNIKVGNFSYVEHESVFDFDAVEDSYLHASIIFKYRSADD